MSETHPLRTLESMALIGIGGFAGSNLRYFVDTIVSNPIGTLGVNVVGSFVLGFVLYEAIYAGVLAERMQVVFATGFLSSLTTYSTFALHTALLRGPIWIAANVLATYLLGFSGVVAGRELARRVDGGVVE